MMRILLAGGADVNATNKYGIAPLHVAAAVGQEGAVRLLLEAGADKAATDNNGDTAIKAATRWGHAAVVRLLQQAGEAQSSTSTRAPLQEEAGAEAAAAAAAEAGPSDPRQCAACGVAGSRRVEAGSTQLKLRTCRACHGIWYCGRKCQLGDWKNHKLDCPGRG